MHAGAQDWIYLDFRGMCLCNECVNMTTAKTGAQTEQSDTVAPSHCRS